MTTIVLPSDIEAWARKEVAAGRAESVEGFITDVLHDVRVATGNHKDLVEEAKRSVAAGRIVGEASMDEELDRWIAEDTAPR